MIKSFLFPFMLAVLGIFSAGAVAELGVRLLIDDGMQFDIEMWKYARDIKIVSSDAMIGHEHGPNREAKLMGVNFATNSQGLRDREFAFKRVPGTFRLLMLGDSLTVGWGVRNENTFSKRLERLFNESGINAEVINTGVGNWNTSQEVQYFLTDAHRYSPDVVILNYFVNDAEPVPDSSSLSFITRNCYLCVVLAGRADALLRLLSVRQKWEDYYLKLYDSGNGPGWLASKSAIKRLSDYCKANNIILIIASLPELREVRDYRFGDITNLVQDAAKENDVLFVDMLEVLKNEDSPRLWVSRPDPHPNAVAHGLIARGLFDYTAERLPAKTVAEGTELKD